MVARIRADAIPVFSEGRGAAAEVDAWLSAGSTRLPSAGGIKTRVIHPAKSDLDRLNLLVSQAFVPPPSKLPNGKIIHVEA
jgi:hypothetical protein